MSDKQKDKLYRKASKEKLDFKTEMLRIERVHLRELEYQKIQLEEGIRNIKEIIKELEDG